MVSKFLLDWADQARHARLVVQIGLVALLLLAITLGIRAFLANLVLVLLLIKRLTCFGDFLETQVLLHF
jgi:hypothetical protein